jgi:adenine-specific DNA-methyltransferase
MMNDIEKLERLASESPDQRQELLQRLKDAAPEAFAEGKLDFDTLKTLLGEAVETGPERYTFNWAGKRDAMAMLQAPTRATLVPDHQGSVDFENSQHAFIEGDNLEVLKVLYRSYHGRVKLIYIDPPYNTGQDFVYPDNFNDPLDHYMRLTGQKTGEGDYASTKTDKAGRFHSSWLSMMYPRLSLARQLLTEDGVIFASISDIEYHRLRELMDEIFGEELHLATFIWKSRHNVDSRTKTGVSKDHEYIVCYGKKVTGKGKDWDKYSNPDNDERGDWMSDNLLGLATKDRRPNLHYDLINPETGINYGCPEKGWRYNRKSMDRLIREKRILWPKDPSGRPRHKKFSSELKSKFTGYSTLLDAPTTSSGTQEVRELFGKEIFDFPKPVGLLKSLIQQASEHGDLVLDFFAGSGSFGAATLEANREDGCERRFVLVQLPEILAPDAIGRSLGYTTISEMSKARLSKQLAKIQESETEDLLGEVPSGFRSFKLTDSNITPWKGVDEKTPEGLAKQLEAFQDTLVQGWKPEGVVWEAAIREGYSLTAKLEPFTGAKGGSFWRVTDTEKNQSFTISLDEALTLEAVRALDLKKEDLFICRATALTDTLAANLALQCRLKVL